MNSFVNTFRFFMISILLASAVLIRSEVIEFVNNASSVLKVRYIFDSKSHEQIIPQGTRQSIDATSIECIQVDNGCYFNFWWGNDTRHIGEMFTKFTEEGLKMIIVSDQSLTGGTPGLGRTPHRIEGRK